MNRDKVIEMVANKLLVIDHTIIMDCSNNNFAVRKANMRLVAEAILTKLEEAGYRKLSDDQSFPMLDPHNYERVSEVEMGMQILKDAGWKRVE